MMDNPGLVMRRLAEIEADLCNRQVEYESAAEDRARLTRDWDRRVAIATAQAKGGDANARKQAALVMAADQDDLYDRLKDAEARFAALHAVVKVLEDRSTIGMSILRSHGRA
jgi:hypothetical protein